MYGCFLTQKKKYINTLWQSNKTAVNKYNFAFVGVSPQSPLPSPPLLYLLTNN